MLTNGERLQRACFLVVLLDLKVFGSSGSLLQQICGLLWQQSGANDRRWAGWKSLTGRLKMIRCRRADGHWSYAKKKYGFR